MILTSTDDWAVHLEVRGCAAQNDGTVSCRNARPFVLSRYKNKKPNTMRFGAVEPAQRNRIAGSPCSGSHVTIEVMHRRRVFVSYFIVILLFRTKAVTATISYINLVQIFVTISKVSI